jgi:pilus assembly protein Flp/PilA
MAQSPCSSAEQGRNACAEWYELETGRVVMKTIITRFVNDESGATAIEYGLIAAIVGIGIIVGLGNVKTGLNNLFNNVNTQLSK